MGRPKKNSNRPKEKPNKASKNAQETLPQFESSSLQSRWKVQQLERPEGPMVADAEARGLINNTTPFFMENGYTKDMSTQWIQSVIDMDPTEISESMTVDAFKHSSGTQFDNLDHSQPSCFEELPTRPEPSHTLSALANISSEACFPQSLSIPEDTAKPNGATITGLSRQLTSLLFHLRLKKKIRWTTTEEDTTYQTIIFNIVTRLCDVVQTALSFGTGASDDMMLAGEECRTSLQMLTITAISCVVDIYHTIEQAHSVPIVQHTNSGNLPRGEQLATTAVASHNCQSMNWDSLELTRLLHLVTMNFHLSKLQKAVDVIRGQCFHIEMADSDLEIQHLRSALQRAIDRLECR